MAFVTKTSSWIARQWRRGWDTIPIVMISHCLTTPLIIGVIIYKYDTWNYELPAEKYRMTYTVMRSDDPRVARINHESRLDVVGFVPPKLPQYQYPM